MATSSIVEKIKINNPKAIEKYVAAMEASANTGIEKNTDKTAEEMTDPSELKKLMELGLKNGSKK